MPEKVEIVEIRTDNMDASASVQVAAFPDSLVCRLGHEAVVRQIDWLLHGPHQDSFGLLATVDDRPAAIYIGGIFSGATTGYLRANVWFLLSRFVSNPGLLLAPEYRAKARQGVNLVSGIATRFGTRSKTASDSSELQANATAIDLERVQSFGHLVLGVDPAFRRRRLGSLLMEKADQRVEGLGYQHAHLRVVPGNDAIQRLHESRGYRIVLDEDSVWRGIMAR